MTRVLNVPAVPSLLHRQDAGRLPRSGGDGAGFRRRYVEDRAESRSRSAGGALLSLGGTEDDGGQGPKCRGEVPGQLRATYAAIPGNEFGGQREALRRLLGWLLRFVASQLWPRVD